MSESTSAESWRPVAGYEDRYLVSDQGRVWSTRAGRCLRLSFHSGGGYLLACLSGRTRSVHRLVLEAFVGSCPEGMECCHGPGGPTDNRLVNLRWDTHQANLCERFGSLDRCPRGHGRVEANNLPRARRRGGWECWACSRAHNDASTARRRGEYVADTYATADWHYARLMAIAHLEPNAPVPRRVVRDGAL